VIPVSDNLHITFHPTMPEEFGVECERCEAVRGAPCVGAKAGSVSHPERRSAWLLYLATNQLGDLADFDLWNAVLAVVEELPESEQVAWKRRHLNELRMLSGVQQGNAT
jgi:hypothetical protein